MKRKLIPLILLIVFVAVIAGAYLLYQRLAGNAQPGLVVEPGASTSESSPAAGFCSFRGGHSPAGKHRHPRTDRGTPH